MLVCVWRDVLIHAFISYSEASGESHASPLSPQVFPCHAGCCLILLWRIHFADKKERVRQFLFRRAKESISLNSGKSSSPMFKFPFVFSGPPLMRV